MIHQLHIENFKSIRKLDMDCGKINVFIGEPNSGKSNIIEAITLASVFHTKNISDSIRYQDLSDLFFDNNVSEKIRIRIDQHLLLAYFQDKENPEYTFDFSINGNPDATYSISHAETGVFSGGNREAAQSIHFYKFKPDTTLNNKTPGHLRPPFGNNLAQIIISNPEFRQLVSDIFAEKRLNLNIHPTEKFITVSKIVEKAIFSYPYSNISETLRRIIFLMACLETNKNSTLLFDEPEANTFPFYTKYIAERMALDETNQYFFTTHNPYLLRSVVEKASKNDLRIVITFMENYETRTRVLNNDELNEILDTDIFFNLDLYIKHAADS